ncbi:MAG: hypothetical protein ACFFAS_04285 [Promethearchaeota archaeon]
MQFLKNCCEKSRNYINYLRKRREEAYEFIKWAKKTGIKLYWLKNDTEAMSALWMVFKKRKFSTKQEAEIVKNYREKALEIEKLVGQLTIIYERESEQVLEEITNFEIQGIDALNNFSYKDVEREVKQLLELVQLDTTADSKLNARNDPSLVSAKTSNDTVINRVENSDCIGQLDSYESSLEVSETEIDRELEHCIESGNLMELYALGKVQTMRYKQRLDEIETKNIEKDITNSSENPKMTRNNDGIVEKRPWRPFMNRKSKRVPFNVEKIIVVFALIPKYDYVPIRIGSNMIERLKELKDNCKNCGNKTLDLNQKICEFCGLDL